MQGVSKESPSEKEMFIDYLQKKDNGLIVKFTADWCGPCKRSKPFIEENLRKLDNNIKYLEIDVDESLEVYGFLKAKRMVTTIPCLLYYKKDTREIWPEHIISSSSKSDIDRFFEYCRNNK